jgi:hypothetical protein
LTIKSSELQGSLAPHRTTLRTRGEAPVPLGILEKASFALKGFSIDCCNADKKQAHEKSCWCFANHAQLLFFSASPRLRGEPLDFL